MGINYHIFYVKIVLVVIWMCWAFDYRLLSNQLGNGSNHNCQAGFLGAGAFHRDLIRHLFCPQDLRHLPELSREKLKTVLLIRRANRDNLGVVSHTSPFKHLL